MLLDIGIDAIRDIAQNGNLKPVSLLLEEFPDDIPPVVQKVEIDYNTGVLKLFTNEIVDVTPTTFVNLSQITISNVTDNGILENAIFLTGSSVIAVDSQVVTITLTEAQRVSAIKISGTAGGDGTSAKLNLGLNSILDFSLLGNVEAFNMTINETADITPMVIVKAEIKLGEGILFLQMNETLHTDGLSKVDQLGRNPQH